MKESKLKYHVILILTTLLAILLVTKGLLMPIKFNNFSTIMVTSIIFIAFVFAESTILNSTKILSLMLIPALVFILCFFTTSKMFNASKYRALLGNVEEKVFTDEMTVSDSSELPTVTYSYAKTLAERNIGDYGSLVEVNEGTLQSYNGGLYYVFPLEHKGFFQWLKNKEGTPGYIMINACNDREVSLVTSINGEDISIKYQPSAFFGQSLYRHLYNNGYATKIVTDESFEIDDNGRPTWVCTIIDNTIGLSGSVAKGIVIVDAITGEISEYSIDETPEYVDRIQPDSIVQRNVKYWGAYINGFWNFSHIGKLQPSEGYGVVYNNGKCYYYTGLTSVGKDSSTVGFLLIDTRTQETVMFKMTGTVEESAVASSESEYSDMGYKGNFPTLVNVEGTLSYFVVLQDSEGLAKRFSFVNVSNSNIIGTGKDITEAKTNYLKSLSSTGTLSNTVGDVTDAEGTVMRINSYILDGNSYYMIMLDSQPGVFFSVPMNVSNEVVLTKEGDMVKLSFLSTGNSELQVTSFDNISI